MEDLEVIKINTKQVESDLEVISKIKYKYKAGGKGLVITAELTPEQFDAIQRVPDGVYELIENATVQENMLVELRDKFL